MVMGTPILGLVAQALVMGMDIGQHLDAMVTPSANLTLLHQVIVKIVERRPQDRPHPAQLQGQQLRDQRDPQLEYVPLIPHRPSVSQITVKAHRLFPMVVST